MGTSKLGLQAVGKQMVQAFCSTVQVLVRLRHTSLLVRTLDHLQFDGGERQHRGYHMHHLLHKREVG